MYVGHLFKGEIGSPECIHAVLFETTFRHINLIDLEVNLCIDF